MKMRELERKTGVHRETIRVYLRHGLMPQPQRPKANVAEYGEEHVSSVIAIRRLQKERRLPLERIKRALEGDTSVMAEEISSFPHLDRLIAARVGVDDALVPLPRKAQAETDAKALAAIGAIKLLRRGGKPCLSRIDAQLLSLWTEMRAAGFDEKLGFTAEVCRLHVEAAEKLAHAELRIFLSHTSGQQAEDSSADMAQAALTHMLGFFGLIRIKTVLADLRLRKPAPEALPATPASPRARRR